MLQKSDHITMFYLSCLYLLIFKYCHIVVSLLYIRIGFSVKANRIAIQEENQTCDIVLFCGDGGGDLRLWQDIGQWAIVQFCNLPLLQLETN